MRQKKKKKRFHLMKYSPVTKLAPEQTVMEADRGKNKKEYIADS